MNDPLIIAHGLGRTYRMGKRNLEVLRGVDLSVARGEFVALRGASGAGKSTLLHLLGGLDQPDAGEISFAGKNLAKLSGNELADLRNHKVGFVFQAYHLPPVLPALESASRPARIPRRLAADAAKRGRELLGRVGLGERVEPRPYELSGGEQ